MRLSSLPLALLLLAEPIGVLAQSTPNSDFYYGSVIESFRKHDPQMVHFSLIYKGQASDELDVILVRGGGLGSGWLKSSRFAELFEGDLLGVFLVSRANPALAYELAIESDLNAYIVVERDEPGEITIRPFNDYGISEMRRKYFYRTPSKQLIAKKDFWPNGLEDAFSADGRMILWSGVPDLRRRHPTGPSLAMTPEGDGFREVDPPLLLGSAGPGAVDLVALGEGCKLLDTGERLITCESEDGKPDNYRVPLAEFARFAAARPEKVGSGWTEEHAVFNETIGPHQLIGQDLWFGITFSDGEGHTGVGGFGLFDSRRRQFEIHYPQEMADWSVSALLVEDAAIWMALEGRGEGHPNSGGLVRWDRTTQDVERWPDAPRALGIARQGERLYMATDEGAAIFENGEFTRFILDVDANGEYRLVKRELR